MSSGEATLKPAGGRRPLHRDAEEVEESEPITIGAEDRPPFIAAGGDVVESAGELDAKWSCPDTSEKPYMFSVADRAR